MLLSVNIRQGFFNGYLDFDKKNLNCHIIKHMKRIRKLKFTVVLGVGGTPKIKPQIYMLFL